VFACFPEPPPDLAELPPTRPVILRASVVPNPSAVLGYFPEKFIIHVELADPTQPFQYVAYLDYNPFTGGLRVVPERTSEFQPSNTRGRVRTFELSFAPPSPDRCHLIEVIVARAFVDDGTVRRPIEPPGGDVVSWFYNPGGALQGCPTLDAGVDGQAANGDGGIQ
jgi:hypothetical protein